MSDGFLQLKARKIQIQRISCFSDIQIKLRIFILQNRICKMKIQHGTCMSDFTVRTAEQLPALLQGFRKQAGLTQAATAMRLGVTQQTLSALERNAGKVSADRLLELLSVLGVELVLRQGNAAPALKPPAGPNW
jgi:HTH-type transcriptional regulator/antitoxin HipB